MTATRRRRAPRAAVQHRVTVTGRDIVRGTCVATCSCGTVQRFASAAAASAWATEHRSPTRQEA